MHFLYRDFEASSQLWPDKYKTHGGPNHDE